MNRIELETERLRIYVASLAEMEQIVEAQISEELKKAYKEMLDGYLDHPEHVESVALMTKKTQ